MGLLASHPWYDRPFIAGDLPSWIAVGLGIFAVAVAYWAIRRPQSRFSSFHRTIDALGGGRFKITLDVVVTTLGASVAVDTFEFLMTSGGMGIGFFRMFARPVRVSSVQDPFGQLIISGGNLLFSCIVTIPRGTDRAWGRVRLRLSDGSKKRYKLKLVNLKQHA